MKFALKLYLLQLILYMAPLIVFGQQDVDFHLNSHFLTGKPILKVKKDSFDPYIWVLSKNNEIYRINSVTLSIDDYTSTFAAYSATPFIDISGLSGDTVFVATKAQVIEYKKGVFKTIGAANGITDEIVSIGVDTYDYLLYNNVVIGTIVGQGRYNWTNENVSYFTYPKAAALFGPVKIFESNYRSFFASNFVASDLSLNYPYTFDTITQAYAYNMRYYTQSGSMVNTAFYTLADSHHSSAYGGSVYWGNDTGLYQEKMLFDNSTGILGHFLDNIKVNKITSIMGLKNSSYVGNLCKENLLIGTDNGLYFSNSVFNSFVNQMANITLFHYNELGNIPINDICINGTIGRDEGFSDFLSVCEDGVWLATNDGVYLTRPDYGKYFDPTVQYNAIQFNGASGNETDICAGSSITLSLTLTVNNAIVQWTKNGNSIMGQNGNQLTVTDAGDYAAVIYSPCDAVSIATNHLKVNVISGPTFIFNYPDKIQYCDVTSTPLTVAGSAAYSYRWYKNGILNGNTTPTQNVTQSGNYKVEVSACTNTWFPSKDVEVDLVNLPTPNITTSKAIYCAGDNAVMNANVPADLSYIINWYRDGGLVPGFNNLATITTNMPGTYVSTLTSTVASCSKSSAMQAISFVPLPTITFNYPDVLNYCDGSTASLQVQSGGTYNYRWYKNGVLTGDTGPLINITQTGSYKVEASACVGSWVPSKTVQVNFIKLPVPLITTDKPIYCIGDNATLSVSTLIDPTYTIRWFKDNVELTAQSNLTSLTTAIPGNYMIEVSSNLISCDQTSTVKFLTFNPEPTVSIQKIIKTTLCDGQTIDLKVNYSGGTVAWSTGENTDKIAVTAPGTYKSTVTSAAGCVAEANMAVQFLPNPIFKVNDTTICTYSNQTVTLTAPAGYSYSWNNGASTLPTYRIRQPQTVSLTITDANGCQTTHQIVISSQCPEVYFANTFTPNGDSINDTWDILGLENDPSVSVRVYNRSGTLVYQSTGYTKPWDGTYKGKKLPASTYYYIINAKNGKQTLSGSVSIIY